jgi:hypothetical protein
MMALDVFWTELGDLLAALRHSRSLASEATIRSQHT